MGTSLKRASSMFVCLVTAIATTGTAFADKPSWAGGGDKGDRQRQEDRRDAPQGRDHERDHARDRDRRGPDEHGRYFDDRRRTAVHDYYAGQFKHGRCPPGLAKKHNGCMPPGQARKWAMGQPLPHDVVYYPVPQPVLVELGPPPAGHKFVRVAGDILLIAIGTGMVVDAIQDIGR